MKFFRKSQAAMEFLMTYGWAILVVLVAIGALAYFGVLSPDKFLPSKCTLPAGIVCTDFLIDSTANTVEIFLTNGIGFDISAVTIAAGPCPVTAVPLSVGNGGQTKISTAACSPVLDGGDKFNHDLQLTYTNSDSDITHTVNGTITGKVS
jgi:hypothetical protein